MRVQVELILCYSTLSFFAFSVSISRETYCCVNGTSTASNLTSGRHRWVYVDHDFNFESMTQSGITCYPLSREFDECIKWKLDHDEYSLDHFLTLTYRIFKHAVGDYRVRNDDGSAYVCVPDEQRPMFYFLDYLYFGLCIISTVSLVVAIIVELMQPIKNQDRKALVCHMLSLLGFYLTRIFLYAMKNPQKTFCYFLAYATRYSIRAAFTWITVLNFDLCQQMRPINILKRGRDNTSRHPGIKKFVFQSIFAWIVPALMMGVTYLLQYADANDEKEYCSLPLSKSEKQKYFLYAATGFLLLINIVLFTLVIINLCRFSFGVEFVNDKINHQLSKFYFKLMVVSGIYWILEMPVWFTAHGTSHAFSLIVDLITFTQGFFLFLLVYVSRKSVCSRVKVHLQNQTSKFRAMRIRTPSRTSITTTSSTIVTK